MICDDVKRVLFNYWWMLDIGIVFLIVFRRDDLKLYVNNCLK